MKKDYTHISLVIDASGSMNSLVQDTLGGFNSFIESQKKLPGKASVSLWLFNDRPFQEYEKVDINSVNELTIETYRCGGMTALLDAMGTAIKSTGIMLKDMNEEDRPEKVIFCVITDGEENRSMLFSRDKVKGMVEHQKNIYKWDFVFMGANQDSFLTAGNLGIDADATLDYVPTKAGVAGSYRAFDQITMSARLTKEAKFTDEDRLKALGKK